MYIELLSRFYNLLLLKCITVFLMCQYTVTTLACKSKIPVTYETFVMYRTTKLLLYPVYSRCMTANFFCTLNQHYVSTFLAKKKSLFMHIHTRHDCSLSTVVWEILEWQFPITIIYIHFHSQNIFFKETACTK